MGDHGESACASARGMWSNSLVSIWGWPCHILSSSAVKSMKSWPKEIHFYRYVYVILLIYYDYDILILYRFCINIDRRRQNCQSLGNFTLWVASMLEYWGMPWAMSWQRSRSARIGACACRTDWGQPRFSLGLLWGVPSGYVKRSYWKWPIEIVDLPIKNGDFP